MDLVEYQISYSNEWDAFVQKAINSTFLHSRSFYDHNPLNGLDDSSLMFFKEKVLVSIFPANKYVKNGQVILHSYLRATYGGVVLSKDIGLIDCIEIIKLMITYSRKNGIDRIVVRPSFSIYHSTLAQHIDYALWQNGFRIESREIELAIPLSENCFKNFDSSTKRNIRKAIKNGVVINENGVLEDYWELLTDNLSAKHQAKPVHSIDEIKSLIAHVGTDKVKLFTAEYGSKTISGILVFLANDKVVHAQYIAMNSAYQELRSLNLVIDHITKWAIKLNYSFFNLGMSCEPGGLKINEGLTEFKEGFGARGVLRETLFLDIEKE